MTTQELIIKLKIQGYTKWKISKILEVSWQTIHMWERGTFKATIDKKEKLESLLKKTEHEE